MSFLTDKREKPFQAVGEFVSAEDMSHLLPILARVAGFELRSMTFRLDPFVLYNKFGQVVYEWKCGFEPTWQDVYEVCQKLV